MKCKYCKLDSAYVAGYGRNGVSIRMDGIISGEREIDGYQVRCDVCGARGPVCRTIKRAEKQWYREAIMTARDLVASLFWSWRRMEAWLGKDSMPAKNFELAFYMVRSKLRSTEVLHTGNDVWHTTVLRE